MTSKKNYCKRKTSVFEAACSRTDTYTHKHTCHRLLPQACTKESTWWLCLSLCPSWLDSCNFVRGNEECISRNLAIARFTACPVAWVATQITCTWEEAAHTHKHINTHGCVLIDTADLLSTSGGPSKHSISFNIIQSCWNVIQYHFISFVSSFHTYFIHISFCLNEISSVATGRTTLWGPGHPCNGSLWPQGHREEQFIVLEDNVYRTI